MIHSKCAGLEDGYQQSLCVTTRPHGRPIRIYMKANPGTGLLVNQEEIVKDEDLFSIQRRKSSFIV